mgnify:CR=1 FL=1
MEELLFDSIRMKIPDAQFRMSTDSMVLADFCRIRPGSRVLDLGCGCGTLGLLLLGADETLRVCGIEIQEAAARQAQENAEENGFSDHLHIVCGDLRQAHAEIAPGSFDCPILPTTRREADICMRRTASAPREARSAARLTRSVRLRRERCGGAGGFFWFTSRSGWSI